jgi:hypothetical protein
LQWCHGGKDAQCGSSRQGGAAFHERLCLLGEPTGIEDRAKLRLDWSQGHNQAVINGVGRIGYMKGDKAALWKDKDMADQFTRRALAFIERAKDKPFFLYFATHDIHVPGVGRRTRQSRGRA